MSRFPWYTMTLVVHNDTWYGFVVAEPVRFRNVGKFKVPIHTHVHKESQKMRTLKRLISLAYLSLGRLIGFSPSEGDPLERHYARLLGWPENYTSELTTPDEILQWYSRLKPRPTQLRKLRVGSPNDGGYVLPDLDYAGATLHSAGIADNCDFEMALAGIGVSVYMIDGSIERPPVKNLAFNFESKFLWTVSSGEKFLSVDSWFADKKATSDESADILKLDIEGSEWQVLAGMTSEQLKSFSVIVVELHWLENLRDGWSMGVMSRALDTLQANFDVIHLHPNNFAGYFFADGVELPRVVEATLIRRRLKVSSLNSSNEMTLLDSPNNPDAPEIYLPNWEKLIPKQGTPSQTE